MKKSGFVVLALAGGLILFAAFIRPNGFNAQDPPKGIPDSVWATLETSCYDCHSNDGNGMAKVKMNLDKWDEYAPDKQMAKAQDICEVMGKGAMPPSKYRINNPDAVPTPESITRICAWVHQKAR
ncbi:MAG: hypothetical protein D4R67_01645 [Bacteroidetes bacterium]|nr:MAG: hypothetical protein D4R67_01645 [Bacteroidota bacterium]